MVDDVVEHSRPIVSRAEARKLGLPRYFTGKPCKYGHITERTTKFSNCLGCYAVQYDDDVKRQMHYAASRRWKAENSDQHKTYWQNWYASNYDPNRQNAWYTKKREHRLTQARRWRAANKDKCRLHEKTYCFKNPLSKRIRNSNRRARVRNSAGCHTDADILNIHRAQKGKCAYCRVLLRGKWHVDHIVPLFLGGHNGPSNLQLTCPQCNLEKGAKHPLDFARVTGRLL